jgi:hypothetical protein
MLRADEGEVRLRLGRELGAVDTLSSTVTHAAEPPTSHRAGPLDATQPAAGEYDVLSLCNLALAYDYDRLSSSRVSSFTSGATAPPLVTYPAVFFEDRPWPTPSAAAARKP